MIIYYSYGINRSNYHMGERVKDFDNSFTNTSLFVFDLHLQAWDAYIFSIAELSKQHRNEEKYD